MLTTKQACDLARALPEVSEKDHFGSDAFRTPGGTFATVWHEKKTVNLALTPDQQRRFAELDGEGFVPIDNAWGRQGWTTANLEFVEREQFVEALRTAWHNSAEKKARRVSKSRASGQTAKKKTRASKKR